MGQEREEYKGRRIELRAPETGDVSMREDEGEAGRKSKPETSPELIIDDTPIEYGQLPDGKYFLREYAYDWRDDLIDLAKGFIDYQIRTDEIKREGDEPREGAVKPKEEK